MDENLINSEKNNLGQNDNPSENSLNNSENIENIESTELNSKSSDSLSKELAELKEKYVRIVAEYENFRKRTAKEKFDIINTAGKDIVLSFLEVLDDCERAEKILDSDANIDNQKEGIRLIFNKFRILMQNRGIVPIESMGQSFDSEKHEAIGQLEVKEDSSKGKIIEEISKGYLMNKKIIRFAKVIVGK